MAHELARDLQFLAWLGAKQLTNTQLKRFVYSRSADVRSLVIQEFHMRPSHDVFEFALSLLHAKRTVARSAGYLILGQLGTPDRPFRNESMFVFMQGIDSEKSPSVREAIAYAVGHLDPPPEFHEQIIKGFLQFMEQDSVSLRMAIAFAIEGLSRSVLLDRLIEKLLDGANQDVREWVELGLEIIDDKQVKL